MTTLDQAQKLAAKEVREGHAIQWLMLNGQVHIQYEGGWQVAWPHDPEPDNHPDCNH